MEFICKHCKNPYNARPSANRKYCSTKCRGLSSVVDTKSSECPQCNKVFQWRRAHKPQKYCSRECANLGKRRVKNIVCKNCGDVFGINWKGSKRKYCSTECSNRAMDTRVVVNCQICDSEFRKRPRAIEEGLGKYCSNECRHEAKRNKIKRTCETCGEEFYTIASEIKRRGGRYCSINCFFLSGSFLGHGHARGGKREDLDNIYFRSSWEANYARILNLFIEMGIVESWEFEPQIFDIGNDNYIPDFMVVTKDGVEQFHEVKGYLSETGKRKLCKMKNKYPEISLQLISEPIYKSLERKYAQDIEYWEHKHG